jgi:hypothetical protein
MDAATAALVGAFGGSGIGFLGALKINADQRREAERTEKRRAFALYLGALYPAVAELREMPPNKAPDLVEQAVDRLSSEQASWLRTRRSLTAASPHLFGRMDRLHAAVAQVQTLKMPPEVMGAFEKANNYVERLGEERTDQRLKEWPEIHGQLLSAGELLSAGSLAWWRRLRASVTTTH